MLAKKDGICKACGDPIREGKDEIKNRYRTWVHQKCENVEEATRWFNARAEEKGYKHEMTANGTYRRI